MENDIGNIAEEIVRITDNLAGDLRELQRVAGQLKDVASEYKECKRIVDDTAKFLSGLTRSSKVTGDKDEDEREWMSSDLKDALLRMSDETFELKCRAFGIEPKDRSTVVAQIDSMTLETLNNFYEEVFHGPV